MKGILREFRPKAFLRQIDKSLLQELVKTMGVPDDSEFYQALEQEGHKALYDQYVALPSEIKGKCDICFTQINDLACDEGLENMILIADSLGIPRHDVLPLNLSATLYLNHPMGFTMARRRLRLNHLKGYSEYLGKSPKNSIMTEEKEFELKQAILGHIKGKELGENIHTETDFDEEHGTLTMVITNEDYLRPIKEFQQGILSEMPRRPIFESTLIYFPKEGKLKIKAKRKDFEDITRQCFAAVYLEDAYFFEQENSKIILNLHRLKTLRQFETNPIDKIVNVAIVGFRGKVSPTNKTTFELRFTGDVEETLRARNIDPNLMVIQKAWIQFTFLQDNGRTKNRTITLSQTNTTNLNDTQVDCCIEKNLFQWGIMIGKQQLLPLLV